MSKGSIVIGLPRLLLCARNDDDNEALTTQNYKQRIDPDEKPFTQTQLVLIQLQNHFDPCCLPKTHLKPQKFFLRSFTQIAVQYPNQKPFLICSPFTQSPLKPQ